MSDPSKYVVGTSGYSFADWVGPFYPPGTDRRDMLGLYVRRFDAVELNFTYYRMPTARTMDAMVRRTPPGFVFWVKANQQITHEGHADLVGQFVDNLAPLREADRLAGVLLQFPNAFRRTADSRRYLGAVTEAFADVPTAVEFRHCSWQHRATVSGLKERSVALVVPDVPDIPGLYHTAAVVTAPVGYLRLHSRNADLWYAGAAERYDYSYTHKELTDLLAEWDQVAEAARRVYAFFNNCHRGQAAANAEAFRRLLGQIE
jgi:uncharacterized protein YecE (DUF72 family)